MIIECINCHKKFEVDSELIPKNGRDIQCGSCSHKWFYKTKIIKNFDDNIEKSIANNYENFVEKKEKIKKNKEIFKKKHHNFFSLSGILSYLIVIIISFVALILILDTFKIQLNIFFPNLNLKLFSLFETLKDIFLFTQNLFL